VFATQPSLAVGAILKEFATAEDGLGLPAAATNQQILDACNVFAAQRFHNYVRNWKRQKIREENEIANSGFNPLGD